MRFDGWVVVVLLSCCCTSAITSLASASSTPSAAEPHAGNLLSTLDDALSWFKVPVRT